MSPPNKYWISEHEGIPKETRNIFNEYLLSIKLENKAEATVSKYRMLLEKFLIECNSLEDLTSDHVRGWLNTFSQNKSPRTIDLMLSCLSSFFKFCLEEEYMESMVIKNRWRPKIPQSLPQFLNEQEYARVKLVSEKMSARDRSLVLFLFSSGCSRTEVSYLQMQDVNMDKRTAKVIGKGNKFRNVHFSVECAFVLKEYIGTRIGNGSDYLFLNKFGNRLGTQSIYKITKKLGKQVGLLQSLHPHVFRHTFATMMIARGADLEFIADELGISDGP